MADLVKGLKFVVDFEQGGEKSLKALIKKIESDMASLEGKLNKTDPDSVRAGRLEERLAELSQAYVEINRQLQDFKTKTKAATTAEKEFNQELSKEQRQRRATMSADLDEIAKNRAKNLAEEKAFQKQVTDAQEKEILRRRIPIQQKYDRLFGKGSENARLEGRVGSSTQLEPGYLQNKLLEQNRGAKVNLPSNYFASPDSINGLKEASVQLRNMRDNLSPTSKQFRALTSEINKTEASIQKMSSRVTNDGMASFRKFSHMLFNFVGILVVTQRAFEGLIQLLTRGAEFESMRQAFQGTTQDIENMRKASRGLLSDEKIFAFSNKAVDLGIHLKDQPIFIDMAIRAMKAYGGGVEKLDEVLEKVIKSTETAQKELSSLGLKKVDFQKKVQDLSKALIENESKYELVNKSLKSGKKVRKDYLLELDTEDQKTVKVQALLALYGKTLKDVTNVEQMRTDTVLSINAQWENFTNTLGQKLLPIAAQVFPLLSNFLVYITKNATNIAAAISTVSVALAAFSVFMFTTGNPLGGVAAALGAIMALVIAFETAYPSASTKIIFSNNEITSSVKEITAAEQNLKDLKAEIHDFTTKAQGEEIAANKQILSQAKEKLRAETRTKFGAFADRIKELKEFAAWNKKVLEADAKQKAKVDSSPWMKIFSPAPSDKDLDRTAKKISDIDEEVKKIGYEILGATKTQVQFGQSTSIVNNLNDVLSGNVRLLKQMSNNFSTMGNAGKAAFWGISSSILSSASAMRQFAHMNELFQKALILSASSDPAQKEMAANLFAVIAAARTQMEEAFSKTPPSPQLPGNNTGKGKKEKGKDLVTWEEEARQIADAFKVKEEIKKSILEYLKLVGVNDEQFFVIEGMLKKGDRFAELGKKIVEAVDTGNGKLDPTLINLIEDLEKVGIGGEEAIKQLKLLDKTQVQKNTTETLTDKEKEQRIQSNITKEYGYQLEFLKAMDVEREIRTDMLEQWAKEMADYVSEIQKINVPDNSKEGRKAAIDKVAESMRDSSKPWNAGLTNLMTFFEMAEIGVHSLAETITSELGQAWDDMFGEANSMFEKFLKSVTTKILDSLITRGIGLLLGALFPGVGTILGAGLNAAVGSGGGGGTLGGMPKLGNYINGGISDRVQARSQGVPYIVSGKIQGKDIKLSLERYNSLNSTLVK